MSRIAVSAVAGVLLLVTVPTAARGAEATRDEVARWADDAAFDDDALARLNNVDTIDGEAIDLERLIAGAERTEIEQRVETLLDGLASDPLAMPDPAAARAEAERILAQDRYQPEDIPRPFRGPLEWIADRLAPVGNAIDSFFGWIADVFRSIADGTPGGAATLWTVMGLAIVLFVIVQTRRVIERRGRLRPTDGAHISSRDDDDPRELERRAAAARSAGDHELEVRLLFRAGVLRLARARAIPARRSLTTGEIRRLLTSNDFDVVGRSFDEIAYGGRRATGSDGDEARARWSRVLHEVGR